MCISLAVESRTLDFAVKELCRKLQLPHVGTVIYEIHSTNLQHCFIQLYNLLLQC